MRRLAPPLVALVGLAFVGAGYVNGDAAAYAAQGWAGDLWGRATHVGYVAVAAALAPLAGDHLPVALDVVGVLAMAAAAAVASRRLPLLGLATVAVLLPWAPFAEVDPLWVALVVLARAGVPAALALAVAVSPVALLTVPWLVLARRSPAPVLEGAAAVVLLTAGSAGAWWTGPRGVLTHDTLLPGRTAAAWGTGLPWLWGAALAVAGGPRALRPLAAPLAALLPLLVVPPDVPAWLVGGLVVGEALAEAHARAEGRVRRLLAAAVGAQLLLAGGLAAHRAARVREEAAVVRRVVDAWQPGDGLVAPWTWGARVAVTATGDPYGLPWHPPGRFLRDQARQWADADVQRVHRLPP